MTHNSISTQSRPRAGAWARDLAEQYDRIADDFESRPSDPQNSLGAQANRAEAAKYHQIAADMDAAFPDGMPPALPAVQPLADPDDRYRGVKALFNGDLHLVDPSYAPREDWIVVDAETIEHVRPVGQR